MSFTEVNGLKRFEGNLPSVSSVNADWNCLLQILALYCVYVYNMLFSLSEVIPNASFLRDFKDDCNIW